MAGIDYSKWDKLSEDDMDTASDAPASLAEAATKTPSKKKTYTCANCRNEGASLRCTVCKKVAYCNRNCQKSDWRFHKRICKKPEKKKKKDAKKPATASSSEGSGSASAPAPAPASSSKPKRKPAAATSQAELDAEDEEIVKSLKGYRYFHRDVSEHEAKIIGDITPERVGGNDSDDDPMPIAAATATPQSLATNSAWNTAKTWEERDMTTWAKSHLESLLVGVSQDVTDSLAEIKELADWDGDASIPVIRGRPRFLYDFTFNAKLEISVPGSSSAKKATVKVIEFSQDEDEPRFELSFQSPKPSAVHQAALRSVIEAQGPLRVKILAALQQFVNDYKAK